MSGIKLIGRAGVSTLCNLVEIHGVDGGKFSTPCFSSYFISSGQLQQEGVSTDDVGGGQKTNEVDVINDCLCVPSGFGCVEDKIVKCIFKSMSSKYVKLIGS